MAFDEFLADRIRQSLNKRKVAYEERKMMGGLCYMVNDKMCIGIVNDNMMCRIGPDIYQESLNRKGCSKMDFTGKPMKGYVFVSPEGYDSDIDFEHWIQCCLDFNPLAQSSKKKS